MRDLIRALTQFGCEVTIYAAERILESIAAERPHHDDPLPDGHTDLHPDDMLPDTLWTPPVGIHKGTIVFDHNPIDRSGLRDVDGSLATFLHDIQDAALDHISRRAKFHAATGMPFDPRRN